MIRKVVRIFCNRATAPTACSRAWNSNSETLKKIQSRGSMPLPPCGRLSISHRAASSTSEDAKAEFNTRWPLIEKLINTGKIQSACRWFDVVKYGATPEAWSKLLTASSVQWINANRPAPSSSPSKETSEKAHWQHLVLSYWEHIKADDMARSIGSGPLTVLLDALAAELNSTNDKTDDGDGKPGGGIERDGVVMTGGDDDAEGLPENTKVVNPADALNEGIGEDVSSRTPSGRMYRIQLEVFDALVSNKFKPSLSVWQSMLLGAMAAQDTAGVQNFINLIRADRANLLVEAHAITKAGGLDNLDPQMRATLAAMLGFDQAKNNY